MLFFSFLIIFSYSACWCSELSWAIGLDVISGETSRAVVSTDYSDPEQEVAFWGLLDVIDMICGKALHIPSEEGKQKFLVLWFDVLYTLAREMRAEQDYAAQPTVSFIKLRGILPFDVEDSMMIQDIDMMSKSKMMKEDDEEEDNDSGYYADDFESDGSEMYGPPPSSPLIRHLLDQFERKRSISSDGGDSEEEKSNGTESTVESSPALRFRLARKAPDYRSAAVSSERTSAAIDLTALEQQMQDRIMEQLMGRLGEMRPEQIFGAAAGAGGCQLIESERALLQAAMEVDSNGLPTMDKESLLRYIKTSALPKLINSVVKGKTGVDVLKSLALGLKVFNEVIGIVEVILKMLLKTTKMVRFYSLSAAEIVAEMAREDDMHPTVDLSVSLLKVREKATASEAPTTKFRGIVKALKNGFKKIELTTKHEDENDPFSQSIQAALGKARDFTEEFNKLPDELMLRILHTIFAELHKRDGVIRLALAAKKHKTLLGLQNSVTFAIDQVYEAITDAFPDASESLKLVPSTCFTDILISLISPIKMDPVNLSAHLTQVTAWIKPMLAILDQEAQLNLLKYLLTDPNAQSALLLAQGLSPSPQTQHEPHQKKFNWSLSTKRRSIPPPPRSIPKATTQESAATTTHES